MTEDPSKHAGDPSQEPEERALEPGPGTSGPRRPFGREVLLTVLLLLLGLAALGWWTFHAGSDRAAKRPRWASGPRGAAYAGETACRECHPGEAASQERSGHNRTLWPAASRKLAQRLDGKTAVDPENAEVSWTYHLRGDRFAVERLDKSTGKREALLIEYAFGSGKHATTFVTVRPSPGQAPTALEHRLTYFVHLDGLGMTPGQQSDAPEGTITPEGRIHDAEETRLCFSCHTTTISAHDDVTLDPATMMPNVTCERCHGAGKAHIEAARKGRDDLRMPFGPGRSNAELELRLCGRCHRHPTIVPPSKVRADNPGIVRFQPVGLMQSACYMRSEGGLSCTRCHDPHARASTDIAAYQAVCLDCHRGAGKPACPVSAESGCVGCHMPKRDSGQGFLFTDHWIRVVREKPDAPPARGHAAEHK